MARGDTHDRLHVFGGIRETHRPRGTASEYRCIGAGEMSSRAIRANPFGAERADQVSHTRIGRVSAAVDLPVSSGELHSSFAG